MAADQGAEQWIDIADFTPGISSNFQLGGDPAPANPPPDAAQSFAQIADTWGCYGHPNGGLHPLPRIVQTVTGVANGLSASHFDHPDGNLRNQIIATHVMSPVETALTVSDPTVPDLFVAIQASRERSTSSTALLRMRQRGILYKLCDSPVSTVFTHSAVTFAQDDVSFNWPGGNIIPVTSGTYWGIALAAKQGSWADPGASGIIMASGNTGIRGFAHIWPPMSVQLSGDVWPYDRMKRDTADNLNNTGFQVNGGDTGGDLNFSHQNRFAWLMRYGVPSTDTAGVGEYLGATLQLGTTDLFKYFSANDLAYQTPGTTNYIPPSQKTRFGSAANGIGVAHSMNASELLMIKHNGGGVVIRGDLDSAQTINMPGIPSIRGACNTPAVSPLGLIYGTADGVWAWNGSDTATPLSPQLDGWFWKPEDGSTADNGFNAQHGKFAYSHPYVLAPNNWVMDTRTNSWFRLADPDVLVYKDYNLSAKGWFYASPSFISTTQTVLAHRFDPQLGARQFSWKSQPLARTRNRVLTYRQVALVASGYGTIEVTVYSLDGSSQFHTFTINSDNPIMQTTSFNVKATDVVVQMVSTADAGLPDEPAPSVWRISLGYRSDQSIGQG